MVWETGVQSQIGSYQKPEEIRRFIPFPKVISLKVNIIAQLEFELTNYDVAVQHISHYAMRTPLFSFVIGNKNITNKI